MKDDRKQQDLGDEDANGGRKDLYAGIEGDRARPAVQARLADKWLEVNKSGVDDHEAAGATQHRVYFPSKLLVRHKKKSDIHAPIVKAKSVSARSAQSRWDSELSVICSTQRNLGAKTTVLTPAQRLTKALATCRKLKKSKRAACVTAAKKCFAPSRTKHKKTKSRSKKR